MALGKRKTSTTSAYTNIPSTGYGTFNDWAHPADWPSIADCALGNIELIVSDKELNTYAFICSTNNGTPYQINWGDGTVNMYASAATAQHTYTVGAGLVCSLGYTTFKITISAPSGALTAFAVTSHSLASNAQRHGILSAIVRATTLTSFANMFYKSTAPVVDCYQLQSCILKDSFPLVTNTTSMFYNCVSLQALTLPAMPLVTTATSMFTSCFSLQSLTLPAMPLVTTATSMFNGCVSLQTITNLSALGSTAASTQGDTMFLNCEQLTNINMPNTKFTTLGAAGASTLLNKLATIALNASSTFSSATAPQLDISYCTLTAAQINAIFAQLPNNLAKTVNITGCTGETQVTLNGTPTTGSTTVTMGSTTGLSAGMEMTGTGIDTAQSVAFTVTTNLVTLANHGIPNGTLVYFPTIVTTTGITVKTPYYVVNAATNTFQVSLTAGGAPIAITTGTGTVFYGNPIQTVNPNTSVVLLIPASSSPGSVSTVSNTALHSLAAGKGWTITG